MQSELPSPSGHFRAYLGGVGSGAFASGLQIVLYPWLVAGVLEESPQRVGYAQMIALLPALVFMLIGGKLSESRHPGIWLRRCYLAYLLPYALLLLLAITDYLEYSLILAFGLGYGAVTAFMQPARESLLPYMAGNKLRETIAKSSLVQFVLQSAGMFLAGRLDQVGLITLCLFQMGVMTLSAVMFYQSYPGHLSAPVKPESEKHNTIRDGLRLVWNDRLLRNLMAIVATSGFLGLGVYVVAIPLLARELYYGGAAFFSALQLTFAAGLIIANTALARGFGADWCSGRVLSWSLLMRGGLLCLLSFELTPWLLFPIIMLWGLLSGWSMVLGRTLTHEIAPRSHRGRVVSVYQLCLFGPAPLGAWACGHLVASLGVLPALAAFGALTIAIAILLLRFSPSKWQAVIPRQRQSN